MSDKSAMNIKRYLDQKAKFYNNPSFIYSDPVSIPHRFTRKEDIEISAFLTAILSWGRREQIIKNASELINLMGNSPYRFICRSGKSELEKLEPFYYRTFNGDDLLFLIYAIREVYTNKGGLENIANNSFDQSGSIKTVIMSIRNALLQTPHLKRSEKHLANPDSGSAAKRINMFLRWMIRQDNQGVDFGIWKSIPQSKLMCPLDVHSGNAARKLGILVRKQNDWKAVEELTDNLKIFDDKDPVKYDFALFGVGVFEGL